MKTQSKTTGTRQLLLRSIDIEFNRRAGYFPCSYVDNGGNRIESFSWFKSEGAAKNYFPGKMVVWPHRPGGK